ncbi:MAG: hypothetical protein WCG27_12765 [Pseudomonadota bacterium]
MLKLIPIVYLLFSLKAYALFGEESAMMIELITTTASQLNELEKLVTNAEKYTERMQKYNELVQDEYFKAERVQYLAEELVAKKEVANLGDLNMAIRELKLSMSDLKELMKEYASIKDEERKKKEEVKIAQRLNSMKEARAQKQVTNALKAENSARANQLTAQNTALIYENQVQMNSVQLETMKGVATTNRLMAEQMEDKRLDEMEKIKSYGIRQNGKVQ